MSDVIGLSRLCSQFATASSQSASVRAYSLQNRLAAEIVLSWRPVGSKAKGNQPLSTIDSGLKRLEELAKELACESAHTGTGFFELATGAALLLLTALSKPSLDARTRQEIEQKYNAAGLRGGSPRQRSSVCEHVAFFEEMASTELPGPTGQQLREELAKLRQALVF